MVEFFINLQAKSLRNKLFHFFKKTLSRFLKYLLFHTPDLNDQFYKGNRVYIKSITQVRHVNPILTSNTKLSATYLYCLLQTQGKYSLKLLVQNDWQNLIDDKDDEASVLKQVWIGVNQWYSYSKDVERSLFQVS